MGVYDATGRDNITPDPVLTQISIRFENVSDYIAPILFPTVRVSDQVGTYRVFGRVAFRKNYGGDVRAPASRANEVEGRREFAEDFFFAREHALEIPVPPEERANARDYDPDADATEEVTQDLLIGKEFAARDLLYDPTVYKTDHVVTLGAGEHFDEYATSDPIGVFRDLFRIFHGTLGTIPNLGVIPWTVMSFLEDHPDIIARYAALGGVITPEQIATALGLQRVVVPGGSMDESNPGQASVLSEIWGNNIVLGLVPRTPRRNFPALGYEFLWPIPGGRRGPDNMSVDTRFDNDRITEIHRVRRRYDLKLVGKDPDLAGTPVVAGMLIEDVLSP